MGSITFWVQFHAYRFKHPVAITHEVFKTASLLKKNTVALNKLHIKKYTQKIIVTKIIYLLI